MITEILVSYLCLLATVGVILKTYQLFKKEKKVYPIGVAFHYPNKKKILDYNG